MLEFYGIKALYGWLQCVMAELELPLSLTVNMSHFIPPLTPIKHELCYQDGKVVFHNSNACSAPIFLNDRQQQIRGRGER